MTAPAGWTPVTAGSTSTGVKTKVWQSVATSTSHDSSVQVALSATAKMTVTLAAYSGTDSTSPVTNSAATGETVQQAAHTTPTLTTSASGGWVVSYWADNSTDTTSWALPAGQVSRAAVGGTNGGHITSVLSDRNGPLAVGTVGGLTATANSASAKAVMVTLVLGP